MDYYERQEKIWDLRIEISGIRQQLKQFNTPQRIRELKELEIKAWSELNKLKM